MFLSKVKLSAHLHFGSIQSVTQGRLSEVPLGPDFTVCETELAVFLTDDAKYLSDCNSFEIFRWEGKERCYFY